MQGAPWVRSDLDFKLPLISLQYKPAYINPTVVSFRFRPACCLVRETAHGTNTRALDERALCIEEAPSLWPPGTVCQCGLRAWAQSNASSWHCAYDTSNSLNCVQLTVMHVLIFVFLWTLYFVLFFACFYHVLYIAVLVLKPTATQCLLTRDLQCQCVHKNYIKFLLIFFWIQIPLIDFSMKWLISPKIKEQCVHCSCRILVFYWHPLLFSSDKPNLIFIWDCNKINE